MKEITQSYNFSDIYHKKGGLYPAIYCDDYLL